MRKLSITLSDEDKSSLRKLIRSGRVMVRAVMRANVLLLAFAGKRNDEIAQALSINRDTVLRIKKRYIQGGIDAAIYDGKRPGQPRKYTERQMAEITALACAKPPGGRKRWSVRLLTDELKKRRKFRGINRETVRLILKKTEQSRGGEECGASRP